MIHINGIFFSADSASAYRISHFVCHIYFKSKVGMALAGYRLFYSGGKLLCLLSDNESGVLSIPDRTLQLLP